MTTGSERDENVPLSLYKRVLGFKRANSENFGKIFYKAMIR